MTVSVKSEIVDRKVHFSVSHGGCSPGHCDGVNLSMTMGGTTENLHILRNVLVVCAECAPK